MQKGRRSSVEKTEKISTFIHIKIYLFNIEMINKTYDNCINPGQIDNFDQTVSILSTRTYPFALDPSPWFEFSQPLTLFNLFSFTMTSFSTRTGRHQKQLHLILLDPKPMKQAIKDDYSHGTAAGRKLFFDDVSCLPYNHDISLDF